MEVTSFSMDTEAELNVIRTLDSQRKEHTSSISGLSPAAKWKWLLQKHKEVTQTETPQDRFRTAVQLALRRNRDQQQQLQQEASRDDSTPDQPEMAREILESMQEIAEEAQEEEPPIFQTMPSVLFEENDRAMLNAVEEEDMSVLSMPDSLAYPDEQMPLLAGQPLRRRRRWSRLCYRNMMRMKRMLARTMKHCHQALLTAYGLYVAMTLFVLAWMLSRYCGNPVLHLLPYRQISISWWLHFAGRQLVVFETSRALQWALIYRLAERTPTIRALMGPLLALLAISSKGWPFLLSTWAWVDLCFLHGEHAFVKRWIFGWTDFASYTAPGNKWMSILCSEEYKRALYCMVLVGIVVSIKRCWVTVRVGKRIYAEFKPRFEKMLQDICLLGEVADLGQEIERYCDENEIHMNEDGSINTKQTNLTPRGKNLGNKVGKVWFGLSRSTSDGKADNDSDDDDSSASLHESGDNEFHSSGRNKRSINKGPLGIKIRLERWKEPNRKERKSDATIEEVLKFECAIQIMGQQCPFGKAFGDASTRDQCILSSLCIHRNLLKLTPKETSVPYDTLLLIMQDCDHDELVHKTNALRRLFRPNSEDVVTELAFVSSCDAVYRRLRFFYASVANAVVLDSLIMRFFDIALGIVVLLAVLLILRFNPLPVLLSMSTVLLSFSFAMGKAVSEYVDGIVLIAFRRPYDLGDRIVLSESSTPDSVDLSQSYFVEGIDLYTTTLRFARTNEVCTIPNGSLSSRRIVNCNRSPAAAVQFAIMFKLDFVRKNGGMLNEFLSHIRSYIDNHPRVWDTIIYHRVEDIDTDAESVRVKIGVRHRNSWQHFPTIMRHKGELNSYMFDIGVQMGMNFSSSPGIRLNYDAGTLKSGKRVRYKTDLLAIDNIIEEKKNL